MVYTPSMAAEEITPETIQTLARLLGVPLLPEDVAPLVVAFRNHLAGVELLDRLDLTDINPNVEFDPRWDD